MAGKYRNRKALCAILFSSSRDIQRYHWLVLHTRSVMVRYILCCLGSPKSEKSGSEKHSNKLEHDARSTWLRSILPRRSRWSSSASGFVLPLALLVGMSCHIFS
jgi:hypothetical protein